MTLSKLVPCGACARHFRLHEPACPFCGSRSRAALRPVPSVLPAGASRSRRYAVSAAFLASAAAFSCGSSTTNFEDDTGTSGDAGEGASGGTQGGGTGGTDQAGSGGKGATGGTSGRGGGESTGGSAGATEGGTGGTEAGAGGSIQPAGNGGQAGAGASSGTGGGGGTLVTGTRACEGSTERAGCRTVADCPPSTYMSYCAPNAPPQGCRPILCTGCPTGYMCLMSSGCVMQCVPECTEENCSGANVCVNGVCTPRPCEEEGANPCPEGSTCDPAYTGSTTHCAPISCLDGFECASWTECSGNGADHGCTPLACAVDEDCGGCGYCINGGCSPNLGVCYTDLPAMPYGCVWPDEELV
jgi:hypothetical protein